MHSSNSVVCYNVYGIILSETHSEELKRYAGKLGIAKLIIDGIGFHKGDANTCYNGLGALWSIYVEATTTESHISDKGIITILDAIRHNIADENICYNGTGVLRGLSQIRK